MLIGKLAKRLLAIVYMFTIYTVFAQQDPQYSQYMYNTMSVNAAYTGQRDVLSITGLYRSQWVGVSGSPRSQTLSGHTPLNNQRLGVGVSIINDQLGPASETYFNANFSYRIPVDEVGAELSLGIKGGFHLLYTDWSKGLYENQDRSFEDDLSVFSPTVGIGAYIHADEWYFGISIPNFIKTDHYNDYQESLAEERLHYYFIGGYVVDINPNMKLKPAFLVKAVPGSPLIADFSGNTLIYERLTLGLAYRWGDALSFLSGFQIDERFFVGYSYDYTTTYLKNYNSGTHEIMLRFELKSLSKIISPRFF